MICILLNKIEINLIYFIVKVFLINSIYELINILVDWSKFNINNKIILHQIIINLIEISGTKHEKHFSLKIYHKYLYILLFYIEKNM